VGAMSRRNGHLTAMFASWMMPRSRNNVPVADLRTLINGSLLRASQLKRLIAGCNFTFLKYSPRQTLKSVGDGRLTPENTL
jgi:hypothetical protein